MKKIIFLVILAFFVSVSCATKQTSPQSPSQTHGIKISLGKGVKSTGHVQVIKTQVEKIVVVPIPPNYMYKFFPVTHGEEIKYYDL